MRIWATLGVLLMISACAPATRTVEEAVHLSKENWHQWEKKYWELYNYEPFDPPAQFAQIRYCYKTDSDIVCYLRPQPNLSADLVGYQGPPPNELLEVIQHAEAGIVADSFVQGDIEVVELEDPRGPVTVYSADGEAEATSAPQGLLVEF